MRTLVTEESVEIVVQINGKIKDRLVIPVEAEEELIQEKALALPGIQAVLG